MGITDEDRHKIRHCGWGGTIILYIYMYTPVGPVAQEVLPVAGQRHFPSALGYLSIALGGAVALPRGLQGEAGHAPRALVLPAATSVAGRGSLSAGQRLEVVDQREVAAVQEKQHGVLDEARAARGALLEDVVALQPVHPQGSLTRRRRPPPARSEGVDVVEAHGAVRRQAGEVHPHVGQSGLPARGAASGAAGQLGLEEGARAARGL